MLPISRISEIEVNTETWKKHKLGKISSSLVGNLIGEKSNEGKFTKSALTYIRGLAGEAVTGKPCRDEFFTDSTNWGNAHEHYAIEWYENETGAYLFRDEDTGKTHKLIVVDEFCGSTPDALICLDIKNPMSKDDKNLKCMPLEVKCPATFHTFIKFYYCNTPLDLKEAEKMYYWQVLDQILCTNSVLKGGAFCAFHPDFPKKGRIIEFKYELIEEDLLFLEKTKEHAKELLKGMINFLK